MDNNHICCGVCSIGGGCMYNRYLGVDPEKDGKKRIFMLPVPYESTVSFRTGTREGPSAILKASYEMESWDEELRVDIADVYSIEVLPCFEPVVDGPMVFVQALINFIEKHIKPDNFLISLGGEHTVALGPISFYKRYFSDLVIIHMDAHGDLRDEYQGSKYSHACVMRRVYDMGALIVQLGVRSLCKEESSFLRKNQHRIKSVFAWDVEDPKRTAAKLKNWIGDKKVYITFDVDVIDPSVLPGTGTPEPGGLDFCWINNFFKEFIPNIHLLGFDVCELSPVSDSVVSQSVVVRVINRIITAMALGT